MTNTIQQAAASVTDIGINRLPLQRMLPHQHLMSFDELKDEMMAYSDASKEEPKDESEYWLSSAMGRIDMPFSRRPKTGKAR